MRKLFVVVVLVAAAASLYAQSQAREPESLYVRTAPVLKVFTHQLGYKVYYLTESGETASFYVPIEWFNEIGGRGSITYGSGPQYPYLSVYWADGKFSHLKLFLIESFLSDTWGVLRGSPSQVAELFKVDEIKLEK
jgi:hypothetical protein